MGTSTNGILFYGFPVEEEDDNHEVIRKAGKSDEDCMDWTWTQKDGVEVGRHCSNDYTMYYITISKSEVTANRGYPQEVTTLEVQPEWDDMLRKFCEKYGLKAPDKFGWFLVSYWG